MSQIMNQVIDVMNDEISEDENVCLKCGAHLEYSDYKYEYQKAPYGDTYATGSICTGYTCEECGHKEEF